MEVWYLPLCKCDAFHHFCFCPKNFVLDFCLPVDLGAKNKIHVFHSNKLLTLTAKHAFPTDTMSIFIFSTHCLTSIFVSPSSTNTV